MIAYFLIALGVFIGLVLQEMVVDWRVLSIAFVLALVWPALVGMFVYNEYKERK